MQIRKDHKATDLPTVSVVTLNWNGLTHLESCYESLHKLDYPRDKLELILVDNGSTDASLQFMKLHFPGVRLIRNRTNLGFCKANNIAAQEANGEYVAFLNNDTRVHPDWLKELVTAVIEDEDVVCAGSRILSWEGDRLDFAGGSLNFHGSAYPSGYGGTAIDPFPEERFVLFPCGCSMLIDRKIFLDCGAFDEDFFAYLEDVDLGWRLWLMGHKVVLAPAAITYHRFRGTAGGLPKPQLVAMTERNALLTIIKNYEDENLTRVLPTALLLLAERAFLSSQIDGDMYRLAESPQENGNHAVDTSLSDSRNDEVAHSKAQDVIRREGLRAFVRKGVRKTWRVLCREFISRFNRELQAVPKVSMSYLVAADDVIRLFPRLMEKRAETQRRRKRSDAEISLLFGMPFRSEFPSGRYELCQEQLIRASGIRDIFESPMESPDGHQSCSRSNVS
jgi:GT2 family glycosyltransferase